MSQNYKGENHFLRPSVFAGSFYPAQKEILEKRLEKLFSQAPLIKKEGNLAILIVPHAAIDYSGAVAASGFKQIEGKPIKTVILLGVSHHSYFSGVAVFSKGEWQTPLGKVSVDENLAEKLIDQPNQIRINQLAFEEEHSLEIEIPFLQKILKDFKIVPLLLGNTDEKTLNILAQKIAANLDSQSLLVISSDLSHYPPYELAQQIDQQTIEAILTGKEKVFLETLNKIEQNYFSKIETPACGQDAIKVALRVAEILSLTEIEKIKYQNSGEVGDKQKVVGYVAIGFWNSSSWLPLEERSQKEALTIAKQTLKNHLSGLPLQNYENIAKDFPSLAQPLGAFVTLYKNNQLRGCIGEFDSQEPLWRVIQKMAIAAATEDPRFPKVTAEELSEIKIEISVLSPLKKIDGWRKIRLGKDGVLIEFGNRRGTFLPQVAQETGWSLEEFLGKLCSQKMGLPPHCYKNPVANLFTFEVQIIKEK